MKIVTVIGARPQFVKAAVVSRALMDNQHLFSGAVEEVLLHTGQHYDPMMSDVFFREMQIPQPKYHLNIANMTHGAMTGRMIESIETILFEEKPDVVLVYGDTNSTLAGSLAATKIHIPVAHVEAGLRSWNRKMPEEINRVMTDHLADFLFCPTQTAMNNLHNEREQDLVAGRTRMHLVGDVMYDAALYYKNIAEPSPYIANYCRMNKDNFLLTTIHRAENTDTVERLASIIAALDEIARETPVLCLLHPRTRAKMKAYGISAKHMEVVEPVGYFDMLELLTHCHCVATDSGGLQKEVYFFQKPCLTLRDETEWLELVTSGWNQLVGSDAARIKEGWLHINDRRPHWDETLYGTGNAGERIAGWLAKTE